MGQHVAVTFFALLVEGTDEREHFWAQKKVMLRSLGWGWFGFFLPPPVF